VTAVDVELLYLPMPIGVERISSSTPITSRFALAPAAWNKRDENGDLGLIADVKKKFVP
jgi:hypothetical protein